MKAKAFFTFQNSCEGVRLDLKFPDKTDSGQWLTVKGTDSPEFQKAVAEKNRNRVNIMALPVEEQAEAVEAASRKLLVPLVVGWSLEGDCTPEAVEELFVNAPDVMDQVDNFCTKRENFFVKPPKN